MAIYAKTHTRTFTESNIQAAFAKTGVVPYNPDVVTMQMMAPSLSTSTTSLLPLGLASPLREVVDLISHHNARKRKCQETSDMAAQQSPEPAETLGSPYTPVKHGLASLATTSASFLVSDSPIQSHMTLPPLFTSVITPPKKHDTNLLEIQPCTQYEVQLQDALRASNDVITLQKQVMAGMQAQTVLQSMYLQGVQGQLQAQEERKKK